MAYAKCYHTGLPMSMCGHCNGTSALVVEPPSVYAVKPHEKLGQPTHGHAVRPSALRDAVRAASHYTKPARSEWARTNIARSLRDMGVPESMINAAPRNTLLNTVVPLPAVTLDRHTTNIDGQKGFSVNHKWNLKPKGPVCGRATNPRGKIVRWYARERA